MCCISCYLVCSGTVFPILVAPTLSLCAVWWQRLIFPPGLFSGYFWSGFSLQAPEIILKVQKPKVVLLEVVKAYGILSEEILSWLFLLHSPVRNTHFLNSHCTLCVFQDALSLWKWALGLIQLCPAPLLSASAWNTTSYIKKVCWTWFLDLSILKQSPSEHGDCLGNANFEFCLMISLYYN